MFSRNLLRVLAVALLAATLAALPAAALPSRISGPAAGRGFLAWLGDFIANLWSDEGMSIDPSGRTGGEPHRVDVVTAPEGGSIDPSGAPKRAEGGSIDPNGV